MDENAIIASEALPFLKTTCIIAIIFLVLSWWWLRRFVKHHPEVLEPDGNPHIKRKYYNFILFIFAFFFLWIAFIIIGVQICSQKISVASIIPVLIAVGLLMHIDEKE